MKDDELYEQLTKAHAATTRRGRGNPPPDLSPPPALEAAWAKLPPIARLQRYHAWKAQQPKTPA